MSKKLINPKERFDSRETQWKSLSFLLPLAMGNAN